MALRREPLSGFDALDPAAQIRLFGKLKLRNCANCARTGDRAGLLLDARGETRIALRASRSPQPTVSDIVFCIDVHCYLLSRAAYRIAFAHEILRLFESIVVYNGPL
jgi:hypothetical protein